MLGHSSIVLTADTCTSVLSEVAHTAAEKTAAHLLQAAGVMPGTTRHRGRGPARAPAPGGEPHPGGAGAAPVEQAASRTGTAAHAGPACRPGTCHPGGFCGVIESIRSLPLPVDLRED
ncbi:type IV secretory pathway TrbL component [Actinomadura cellulosilytica]|uniref:Type IV secretory pathway TrbL component n=1 Tax=Thermomonospora cellulosilytica TaxID=1411118 RepID=A0A7W3R7Y6_9ACTN|nr:type IV secretory pathway TrbL component [Thermomonospora cellulosilytica]